MLNELFEEFCHEAHVLKDISPKTIIWYRYSFTTYTRLMGEEMPHKKLLSKFVVKLLETSLSKVTVNNYIRGFNVFLAWLYENEHTRNHLKIKRVQEKKTVIKTFSDKQLQAIIHYKPKDWYEFRIHAILCFLIDTGCRIEETLNLKRSDFDVENLLVRLEGKGSKERIIPFSIEYRKVLFRWLKKNNYQYVFPTRRGGHYVYTNFLRDMKLFCKNRGIEGVRISPHTLRHTFAYNYAKSVAKMTGDARNGILHLQKQLGHTDLTMTRRYVELQPEDLKEAHAMVGLLSRLK